MARGRWGREGVDNFERKKTLPLLKELIGESIQGVGLAN